MQDSFHKCDANADGIELVKLAKIFLSVARFTKSFLSQYHSLLYPKCIGALTLTHNYLRYIYCLILLFVVKSIFSQKNFIFCFHHFTYEDAGLLLTSAVKLYKTSLSCELSQFDMVTYYFSIGR